MVAASALSLLLEEKRESESLEHDLFEGEELKKCNNNNNSDDVACMVVDDFLPRASYHHHFHLVCTS